VNECSLVIIPNLIPQSVPRYCTNFYSAKVSDDRRCWVDNAREYRLRWTVHL